LKGVEPPQPGFRKEERKGYGEKKAGKSKRKNRTFEGQGASRFAPELFAVPGKKEPETMRGGKDIGGKGRTRPELDVFEERTTDVERGQRGDGGKR